MNADGVVYLDSSAIVRLVERGPGADLVRSAVPRRRLAVSSALARTEVTRVLRQLGPEFLQAGHQVLEAVELVRISDRVLKVAGELDPPVLRTLDAIHLATALQFGPELRRLVTFDDRMRLAARMAGLRVLP